MVGKERRRRPVLILTGAVFVALALGAAAAVAFNPQPEPPAKYSVGVTPDETLLATVVNEEQSKPCLATVAFLDADGMTLASREITIGPGQFTSVGFSPGVREGRVQLRPVVTPMAAACDNNLDLTIEIVDAGGHTQAMLGYP